MAGAKKTWDKATSKDTLKKRFAPNPFKKDEVEKGFGNPVEVLSEGAEDLGGLFAPDIPVPEETPLIPLPTASVAANEARKRKAKSRYSGRQSTILTEGLGG